MIFKINSILIILFELIICSSVIYCDDKSKKSVHNNDIEFISINTLKMYISNNGSSSVQPDNNFGLLWPGGENAFKPLLSDDGLIWGGYINNNLFLNGNIYGSQTLQAGRILDNGVPDNPDLEKYRIYKIRRGWETLPFGQKRDQYERDYNEWPVEDGAPWKDIDGDGIWTKGVDQPDFIGDEILWFVSNDLDEARVLPEQQPVGLEFQTTLYGLNRSGILGDVVFKKVKIINKSSSFITDMYVGLLNFVVVGDENDNYVGCDTTINLAYGYNAFTQDEIYGSPPPSVGHLLVQGPIAASGSADSAKFNGQWIKGYINLNMSGFILYYKASPNDSSLRSSLFPNLPDENYSHYFYNNLQGKLWSGYEIIDPNTLTKTKYFLAGDPESGTGWYEGEGWANNDSILPPYYEGARFYLLSTGSFNIAPFDTQEVVIATIAAQGTDNLNSVTELKRKAKLIQRAYDLNFQLTPLPPQPATKAFEQEGKVTLWWDTNAEDYDEEDPFILEQEYDDTTYTFEGYRIWQYKDSLGRDPRVIAIYDEENEISVIEDYIIANGISVKAPVIFGPNEGLRRYIHIEKDAYNNLPLYDGNEYYFGVTAYSYSKHSSPTYLESEPKIIKVIPGRDKIDYTSPYKGGSEQLAELVVGSGQGKVIFRVIDPTAITGDEYEVYFERITDTLYYSLVNLTRGDTLYLRNADFTLDTLGKKITEGFMVLIDDAELRSVDSLLPGLRPFGIKRVIEIKGPGGVELSEPVNVFENFNSTGKWQMKASGSAAFNMQNYDIYNKIGVDDYEIRFTEQGSEYYTSGYATTGALFRDDPKALNRIPFEIWNVTKDERLNIKIWDRTITDTTWSRNDQTGDWERVYGMNLSFPYSEPLPQSTGVTTEENFPLGNIVLNGEIPEEGTVIKIETFKPIMEGYKYRIVMEKANFTNLQSGKQNIDKITVFPNPYFGGNNLERGNEERIIRFAGLPSEVTIRIYTLAGIFVKRLDKSGIDQYLDWDLRNEEGELVSSGMYIAHLEMPGIGTKILKIAVVMSNEFLNRF